MNRCYLGLGSNQRSPERQLLRAITAIKALPGTSVIRISRSFWNPAWGVETQQNFCNRVIEIHTRLSPLDLLECCQTIERDQGRVRKKRWGPRTLDIDILWYANRHIKTPKLTLPHPYMKVRDFVLIPLREINGLDILDTLGLTQNMS